MDFEASNVSRMKKSPVYPGYEGGDYGFDPQVDFLQFLEEARKQTSQENSEASQQNGEVGKRESDGGKKSRKSWKRSLFSWWKGDRKSNSSMEPLTSSQTSKSTRRHQVSTSGPIYGSGGGGGGGAVCKPRRPTSGPLGGFFHPTKRVENEIAYMCLDKLDDPHPGVQSYGPVYLVS